ncbi:MAG: hypothetical protein QM820_40190 [Minicystis sp.]
MVDDERVPPEDLREGVEPAHGALGDGHVGPADEIQDLARRADRRLDVAIGRRDDDPEDAEVIHRHEQDGREVIVDAAVVVHEDELSRHVISPVFRPLVRGDVATGAAAVEPRGGSPALERCSTAGDATSSHVFAH